MISRVSVLYANLYRHSTTKLHADLTARHWFLFDTQMSTGNTNSIRETSKMDDSGIKTTPFYKKEWEY